MSIITHAEEPAVEGLEKGVVDASLDVAESPFVGEKKLEASSTIKSDLRQLRGFYTNPQNSVTR